MMLTRDDASQILRTPRNSVDAAPPQGLPGQARNDVCDIRGTSALRSKADIRRRN